MAGQLKGESFGQVKPGVNIQRSTFDLSHTHKFTRNSGELIPFFWEEVIAGDTFKVDTCFVVRMLTPVVPVMDNAFLDIFYFFVPARLAFNKYGMDDHTFQKLFGQNDRTAWASDQQEKLPYSPTDREFPVGYVPVGSYLGLPKYHKSSDNKDYLAIKGCSYGPFYAYQTIWNNFFRDENLRNPIYEGGPNIAIAKPYKVCKLHDVYTSALPAPQKGNSVALFSSFVPLDCNHDEIHPTTDPLYLSSVSTGTGRGKHNLMTDSGEVNESNAALSDTTQGTSCIYNNAGVDLSFADVNYRRLAFADQRLKERDARGGTRFNEVLAADYQVYANYAALNIPEYLCGSRTPINLDTVLQTSATSGTSALGDTGAFSNTSDYSKGFVKSFTEPGFVRGVCCVRTRQSYAQGVDKRWKHIYRDDFYNPVFANIGEQPIRKSELFVNGTAEDDKVFGYQEAWYEYRYHKNELSGFVDPALGDKTLSKWTYYEPFKASPVLNEDFIKQDPSNIGDTLVQTNTSTQFICDFGIDEIVTRPMPVFSVPGLLDHN